MEISAGWMLIAISVSGIVGCVVGLFAVGKVFAKQRKDLLEKIESE